MAFYFQLGLFVALFSEIALEPNRGCADLYTCAECIQNPNCGWCSHLKGSEASVLDAKCLDQEKLNAVCGEAEKEAPVSKLIPIKDVPVKESRDGSAVQLQPQEASLQIRAGTSFTIDFKFKKAHDYPIDIYYLLDFSKSMQPYKDNLSKLGDKLAAEMDKRTSKLQLGFGSFVDKVTLPFTDTRPESIAKPCEGCTSPYSFKNHMPLSKNTRIFSDKVKQALMSANVDTPEGGFDGLLQTMVCGKEINWRAQARRIIVFCTDAAFHVAGDGKLGGVVEPHDGQCHLNSQGEYTHGLELDYPSISQIKFKAKEHYINIIFAVAESVLPHYLRLKDAIEGASVGVMKKEKEKDIINLVLDNYNNMSISVDLTHNATGSVEINFATKCPERAWEATSGCSALKGGDQVFFKATIKVPDCSVPEQIIAIKPIGMAESLIVHLKVHCGCDCEKESNPNFQRQSAVCSYSGNLTCGRCVCPDSHSGRHCECPKRDAGRARSGAVEGCRRGNVTCSDRGICSCGQCVCDEPTNPQWVISGDFCECDNYSCPGRSACSGHGKCECSRCQCDGGWSGEACDCPLEDHACRAPRDADDAGISEACSGRGQCSCGHCSCNEVDSTGKRYSGIYCEKCTACKVVCTKEMHDCVDCLVHKTGPSIDSCSHCEKLFRNVTLVPDVSGLQNTSESSVLCQPLEGDDKGCSYQYVPYYHDEELWVYADALKTCPYQVNVIAISAGVAGSTIVAGFLLLLMWKLLTTIHDKREFEKFEKERADTKWGRGDNPLYRRALTTHMNPTFQGSPEEEADVKGVKDSVKSNR